MRIPLGSLQRSFSDPSVFHRSHSFAPIKNLLQSPQPVPLSTFSTTSFNSFHMLSDDSTQTPFNSGNFLEISEKEIPPEYLDSESIPTIIVSTPVFTLEVLLTRKL